VSPGNAPSPAGAGRAPSGSAGRAPSGSAGRAPSGSAGRAPLALGCALFLLSGIGALVVEATWLRWLRLLLGGTAPAVSATLVAFMAGQALGAAWASRAAPRWRRPLRVYAALELGAAAAALAVPGLLRLAEAALDPFYDGLRTAPALLVALRTAVALAAMLPAAACFGATYPALASATLRSPAALGSAGALLYGVNTAGAALGLWAATFLLPERLGVSGGHAVGVACLAGAGAAAWLASGRFGALPAPASAPAVPAPRAPALARLAALSGFGSFAAQVLLTQAFARVLNQSSFAFGAVGLVTLLALAVGALAVAALERSGRLAAERLLGGALVAAALTFAAFPAVFVGATDGLAFLGSERPWPGYGFAAFGLAAATAGPALLAAALVLPATLALAGRAEPAASPGRVAGRLLAFNTAGAVAGALAAPWLLLPGLGLWLALAGLGGLYAAAALFAVPSVPGQSRLLRDVALGLGWMLVISRGSPVGLPPLRLEPSDRLLAAEQGAAGLVAVLERGGGRVLQIDNHYALGGSADAVRQERQGHLPLLLHPAPRRVAFLGSATGSSAGAALAHEAVERLTLVELVPGVAAAAEAWFGVENRGVYRHPRSEVVLDDARNWLRATRARFDVIVGDLFVPWQAGTGALYAREHFAAARARLAPGGVFCQWLPLYQLGAEEFAVIAATFHDVFPDAFLLRGDLFATHPIVALVGGAGPLPEPARVAAAAARLAAAGVADRWVTHPAGVFALAVAPLAPAAAGWAALPRNADDAPVIEFLAARTHGGGAGKAAPFTGLAFAGFAKGLREAASGALAALPAALRRAGDGGHALQVAGALHAAGRDAEAGEALAAAAAALPPELFAEAPPDPTAAEVWAGDGDVH
jgi:spermidine synthase